MRLHYFGAMPHDELILGQIATRRDAESAVFDSLIWFAALIGLLVTALVAALWFRKWYQMGSAREPAGLTLDDLRRQRDQGRLTVGEYERLRLSVVKAMKKDGRGGGK
jgi:cytochrome c biogenesis protein ResB